MGGAGQEVPVGVRRALCRESSDFHGWSAGCMYLEGAGGVQNLGRRQVLAAPIVAFSEGRLAVEEWPGWCVPSQKADVPPLNACPLHGFQGAPFSPTHLHLDQEQEQGSPRTLSLRVMIRKHFEGITIRNKIRKLRPLLLPRDGSLHLPSEKRAAF